MSFFQLSAPRSLLILPLRMFYISSVAERAKSLIFQSLFVTGIGGSTREARKRGGDKDSPPLISELSAAII
ncbi:MAG TPA: hypothetical protein DCP92_20420 [Nitrospiraceae bacterium]|jgi:hypothetical protein|nr:hypothetical protein [Nitrospiraceae bacterium]